MNDQTSAASGRLDGADAALGALIRAAGPRPQPAAYRAARVRAIVEAEWRQSVQPRHARWKLSAWQYAAAASVLVLTIAIFASVLSDRQETPIVARRDVATLAIVAGEAQVSSLGQPIRALEAGERVAERDVIATSGTGRVSLAFASGRSVRLDRSSRVTIEEPGRLRLEHGRVYVDSGGGQAGPGFVVATEAGVIRESGTQFAVVAATSSLEILVREGTVQLERTAGPVSVAASQSVLIPSGSDLRRSTIASHGPEWAWIEALALPFKIEGAKLESFLEWAAREIGMSWRFATAGAARHGRTVVLHGSIDGLTPREALEAVLPTAGMVYELRDGTIWVSLANR